MDWLIGVLYTLAHTLGLLNLFLLVLLYLRDRDQLYLREFALMGMFGLIVISQSLRAIFGPILPEKLFDLGGLGAACGVAWGIMALPRYVQHLDNKLHLIPDTIFTVLSIASLAVTLVSGSMFLVDPERFQDLYYLVQDISLLIFAVVIVFTLALAVKGAIASARVRRQSDPAAASMINETTRLAIRMGIFTLVVLPVLLWLDFAGQEVPGGWMPQNFRVLPLLYLLWNSLLLPVRVRTITSIPTLAASNDSDTERLPALCEAAGISAREREVMEVLITGASYEQIADRLCISLATVKTHVVRLYRKLGVNSKIELIHRLNQH